MMCGADMLRTCNAKPRPERRHRHSQPRLERGSPALQQEAFSPPRALSSERLRGGVFLSNSVVELPSSELDSQKARVFLSNSLSNSHFEFELVILASTSGPS